MADIFFLLPVVLTGAGTVGLTLLVFYLFKWRDHKKPVEKRDSWGPWGVLLPLSAMGLGSVLFAAVANLLLRLQMGFTNPFDYLIITFYGGLALVFSLFIVWSFRGRRQRLSA